MDHSSINQETERSEYLENWYQTEKSSERIAGVLLFFIAGLVAFFDQPGDQWTLYTIGASLAGGITLLTISRRARDARTSLHFLKAQSQTTRAALAGMGAVLLFIQLGMRPLALILGVVLAILAAWFQWRAHKIQKFDELFHNQQSQPETEGE